jgi:hypothetical protein
MLITQLGITINKKKTFGDLQTSLMEYERQVVTLNISDLREIKQRVSPVQVTFDVTF